jgi:hypothetical protein
MKYGDMPAMPCGAQQDGYNPGWYPAAHGLTKRELFAMAAMQGICANSSDRYTYEQAAGHAVAHADALLAALEGNHANSN